ncbi:MAG: AraC family transcriptional regulator [Solirubrobacterales bacterium]
MGKEKNIINFYHNGNIEIVHGRSIHDFPKHSHFAFCIGLVEQGELKLDIEGKEYFLKENDVYFVPPLTEHKISSVNNEEYEYTVLCLNNELGEKYCKLSLNKYVNQGGSAGFRISAIISKFQNTCNNVEFAEDIKKFLGEHIEMNNQASLNTEFLSISAYIKAHLEEPFNLNKISAYTHLSKYHLVRLFKKHMGVAPYQFYMQEKVKKVKQGLLTKETPVDLAYHFNFSDQSHLNNIFKRYVGITPLQFKSSYK